MKPFVINDRFLRRRKIFPSWISESRKMVDKRSRWCLERENNNRRTWKENVKGWEAHETEWWPERNSVVDWSSYWFPVTPENSGIVWTLDSLWKKGGQFGKWWVTQAQLFISSHGEESEIKILIPRAFPRMLTIISGALHYKYKLVITLSCFPCWAIWGTNFSLNVLIK